MKKRTRLPAKSRSAARFIEAKYYFNGKPCKRGHVSKRYTSNGECWQCRQEWREKNRAKTNGRQNHERHLKREGKIPDLPQKEDKGWRLQNYGGDFSHVYVHNLLAKIKWRRSRAEARAEGHNTYFTGGWCKKGHVKYRKTKDGKCLICFILYRRKRGTRSALSRYNVLNGTKYSPFERYKDKLLPIDKARPGPLGILLVRCYKCKKYFAPSRDFVCARVSAINGRKAGEGNFYCSDNCRDSCSVYWKHGTKAIPQENALRKIARDCQRTTKNILMKAQYSRHCHHFCERCGVVTGNLHLHHTVMVSVAPIRAVRIEGQMLVCEKCHVVIHKEC